MPKLNYFGFWKDSLDLPNDIFVQWSSGEKESVVEYLSSNLVLASLSGHKKCKLCDESVLRDATHTDGVWVWPNSLIHYVESHDICLPEAFMNNIILNGYKPPQKISQKALNEVTGLG